MILDVYGVKLFRQLKGPLRCSGACNELVTAAQHSPSPSSIPRVARYSCKTCFALRRHFANQLKYSGTTTTKNKLLFAFGTPVFPSPHHFPSWIFNAVALHRCTNGKFRRRFSTSWWVCSVGGGGGAAQVYKTEGPKHTFRLVLINTNVILTERRLYWVPKLSKYLF